MIKVHYSAIVVCTALSVLISACDSQQQGNYNSSEITKIVFLGTGTPRPDPASSGNSIAIVVNDVPYIIDFGPGLVRNAASMSSVFGGEIAGLQIKKIKHVFLTHLHSDHTAGYTDLILTPWTIGREHPLEVYGPQGIKSMTDHILAAYEVDIKMRLKKYNTAQHGWQVNVHEIEPGIVFKDEDVTVEAFLVEHGSFPESYGYKFTTPDRTIAISGDTRPCENLVNKCKGVDILIHEVYSMEKSEKKSDFWRNYHSQFHTSTEELSEIAERLQPKILILYHQNVSHGSSEDVLIKEIKKRYDGIVVSAKDFDVY